MRQPLISAGTIAIGLALASGLSCDLGPRPAARAEAAGAPSFGKRFSRHWHDGKAELNGYELTIPRYGQARTGTMVTIFVTEPFDSKTHVKPEDPARGDLDVLKLNLVWDFATGIYDYNVMASVFVATRKGKGYLPGDTVKVSTSTQEWCGHVYQQARFNQAAVDYVGHSYFEGEGDRRAELPYPDSKPRRMSEDALWFWARGFAGPELAPGETVEVPVLRSLLHARFAHAPPVFDKARLQRETDEHEIDTPAGHFTVERMRATVSMPDGGKRSWLFEVEKPFPNRIVRASRDDGLKAQLLGSTRKPYWQLNQNGHEHHLKALGLPRRQE